MGGVGGVQGISLAVNGNVELHLTFKPNIFEISQRTNVKAASDRRQVVGQVTACCGLCHNHNLLASPGVEPYSLAYAIIDTKWPWACIFTHLINMLAVSCAGSGHDILAHGLCRSPLGKSTPKVMFHKLFGDFIKRKRRELANSAARAPKWIKKQKIKCKIRSSFEKVVR